MNIKPGYESQYLMRLGMRAVRGAVALLLLLPVAAWAGGVVRNCTEAALRAAKLNVDVNLSRSLALVLDTKMNYLNPKVTNMGKRANLLSVQPTLGIRLSF